MTRRVRWRARADIAARRGVSRARASRCRARARRNGGDATPSRARHTLALDPPLSVYALGALDVSRIVGIARHRHRPRHAAPVRLRIRPVFACLVALSFVAGGAALGSLSTGGALAATVANPGNGWRTDVSIMNGMAKAFASSPSAVALPAATAPPAPAPPSLEGAPALRPHEIFGFAPYWTLPISSGFDLAGLTTLAYFSVDVAATAPSNRAVLDGSGTRARPWPTS